MQIIKFGFTLYGIVLAKIINNNNNNIVLQSPLAFALVMIGIDVVNRFLNCGKNQCIYYL